MRQIACFFALGFVLLVTACAESPDLTGPESASTRAVLQDEDGGVDPSSNN